MTKTLVGTPDPGDNGRHQAGSKHDPKDLEYGRSREEQALLRAHGEHTGVMHSERGDERPASGKVVGHMHAGDQWQQHAKRSKGAPGYYGRPYDK